VTSHFTKVCYKVKFPDSQPEELISPVSKLNCEIFCAKKIFIWYTT